MSKIEKDPLCVLWEKRGLSVRASRLLAEIECATTDDIKNIDFEGALKQRLNFGVKTVQEITKFADLDNWPTRRRAVFLPTDILIKELERRGYKVEKL